MRNRKLNWARLSCALILSAAHLAFAQNGQNRPEPITITPDHADGIYEPGQTVKWHIALNRPATTAPAVESLSYSVEKNQFESIAKGTLKLIDGQADVEAKIDDGSQLLLKLDPPPGVRLRTEPRGGAVAGMKAFKPSADRPADFDAFWDAKIKALGAIPANAKLEKADGGRPDVDYAKITMDNIGGAHIYGQIARPTSGRKFPALLIVQWAGVYSLQKPWVVDHARDGWLCLNIEPHDLKIAESDQFYKDQFAGPLKDYWAIGNDDRDTSYYVRMYLSCYRGIEYLKSCPDWDGKTLVVMGASQGGMQSLMTAGLHPNDITAALAIVPAGCDMTGPLAQRRPGWPQWWDFAKGKDSEKVHEASRYFDVVNFAPHIKCPVLVGAGLIDETCPLPGVLAAFNQINGPKEFILMPKSAHQEARQSQKPFNDRANKDWLPALAKGEPAPVNVPANAGAN